MVEWLLWIPVGLLLLYVVVRFISAAVYQSKLDYFERRKKQNERY